MLISTAHAQTAGGAADPTGGFSGILMMGLMLVVMYFLMIRPQMKRAKEHKALLDALAKGDEVVTNGGVAGTVTEVRDAFVKVEVSSGVEILVQKSAVGAVLPKGTLKSA